MQKIKISELKPHPRNNEFFEDITGAKWDEFLESIKTRGIIEPLIITQDKTVVSGHQRLRAAKALNKTKVSCIFKNYENEDEVLKDLIETNIRQRGTVGGTVTQIGNRIKELERLYGISHGRNQHGGPEIFPVLKTQDQLAEESGMTDKTWRNYKQLSEAIPELKELLDTKKVSQTTALAIMNQLSPEEQTALISSLDTTKKITQKEMQAHIKELQEQNIKLQEQNATLQHDQENVSLLIKEYPEFQSLIDTGQVTPGILEQLYNAADPDAIHTFLTTINPKSTLLKEVERFKEAYKIHFQKSEDLLHEKNALINEHQALKEKNADQNMEIIGLLAKIQDLENRPPLTDEESAVTILELQETLYANINAMINDFIIKMNNQTEQIKEAKYKIKQSTLYNLKDNLVILKEWIDTILPFLS